MVPGREEDAGAVLDFGDGEDEPGVFGDDVGDQEVDFARLIGDDSVVGSAMGVDAVEAAHESGGGFDLDAEEAVSGVEDEVVAFAVAVGFGDVESHRRRFEDEGEFGELSATLGGLFVLLGSLFWLFAWRLWRSRGWALAPGASRLWRLVLVQYVPVGPMKKRKPVACAFIFALYFQNNILE
jgi:hypothetical protein